MKRVRESTQSVLWFFSVLASRVFMGLILGLVLWSFLPMVIQWTPTVVVSGSMEPAVSTGDIIIAQPFTQEEIAKGAVKVGDVTLAVDPAKPTTMVTHRVIEILPDGSFITKGDANRDKDSTPIPRANVKGVERLLIPYIGLPIDELRKGNPMPAAVFALLSIIAQAIILKDRKDNKAAAKAAEDNTDSKDDSTGDSTDKSKLSPALAAGVVVAVLGAAIAPAASTHFSTAAFSAVSSSTGSTFAAAADWTPPTVAMQQPASPLKGTVSITATASDDKSGVKNTTIQYQTVGGSSWTTLCTVATSPYTCSWNTVAVTDGNYDLRAVSIDNADNSTTSATVRTTVANNALVVLSTPDENVHGIVALDADVFNVGYLVYTVRIDYAPAGTTNWKSICTNLVGLLGCSWNTATYTNGDYDLRAVLTASGTTYTSEIVSDITVDNLAPTVTMTNPGTPISGNWTFAATAEDTHSGIDTVTIQYALNGSSTYTNLCVLTDAPFSCRVDTATIPNGTYTFRAVADDAAGNRTNSATITNRVIDNTVSSVSMEDPGTFLSGTVTLEAAASSTAGVASVVIQRAPAGTLTWTTVCTQYNAPYSCSWNTSTVTNGPYDFRAVMTDGRGIVTTSVVVGSRQVDNLLLRGFDFQTAAGAGTTGRPDQGDQLVYTFNRAINLGTVTSGWNGTATTVTVRLRDGKLVGTSSSYDALDVLRNGNTVNLGSVNLNQNSVKNNGTVSFNATMVASTVVVNGVSATKVTITLGTVASGSSSLRTVTGKATMVWTPSAAVLDLNGNQSSTAPVTESGTVDKDF